MLILFGGCTNSPNITYIKQGIAHYNNSSYYDAIVNFDFYLDQENSSPNTAIAWAWKGVTYEQLGRYDMAIYFLDNAVAIGPSDPNVWQAK